MWLTQSLPIAVAIGRNEIAMQNVTLRLREETIDALDGEADEHDVSRSEYIREIVADRHEADEFRVEVENRCVRDGKSSEFNRQARHVESGYLHRHRFNKFLIV